MKRVRGLSCLLIVGILLSLFTGCTAIGIDVESQMRPPKNNGAQELLQNALDQYISGSSEKGEVTQYALKYPNEGRYLSSFILLDEIHAPAYVAAPSVTIPAVRNDNLGNFCVAFYRPDSENAKTHIHLLENTEGTWVSVADIEGYGESITQVDFADIDGDGFPELLTGWNMYNTKDKRLFVYSLKDRLQEIPSPQIYTSLIVSDLTSDAADDLLLLSVEPTTNIAYARLISYREECLFTMGHVQIDSDILSFGNSLTAVFSESSRGVFFDVYKEPHTAVTELVIWEDDMLTTPFYSGNTQMNTVTAREILISCGDIDEDGIVEWPICSRLPGYEDAAYEDAMWKVSWFYYDPATGNTVLDFDSVISTKDGYFLQLTDAFPKEFTALYDLENRVLTLVSIDQEEPVPFLKIQTTTSGKKADLEEGFTYFDEFESLHFAVWYRDDFPITMEEIRYLFSVV